LIKNYVDCNKKLTFCPNPNCGNAVQWKEHLILTAEDKKRVAIKCLCGQSFCFSCGREQHRPITCVLLSKWLERGQDESESLKLIRATAKACFHCGQMTERNQGCNHMTCRKEAAGCGGEWCWTCRGDWSTHGSHTGGFFSCNKYEESAAKTEDDEVTKMKEELDRYVHFYERFFNHETARNAIPSMCRLAIEKTAQYRETVENPGNLDFFEYAVNLLDECRVALKYTYVYAFYLPKEVNPTSKDFFEHLQASAEGYTERLADMVKSPLKDLDIPAFKNRIGATEKYIRNLASGIEEGFQVKELALSEES